MRTSAIPVDKAIELHKTLQSWDRVAYGLFEQTGQHYSPSTIRKVVYRRRKGIAAPVQSNWTDERIELLKKLQAEKLSATKIADEIYRQTGHYFSRNGVISKLKRLGLTALSRKRRANGSAHVKQARRHHRKPSRIMASIFTQIKPSPPMIPFDVPLSPQEPAESVIPIGQRLTVLELTSSTCKWPINDPPRGGEHLFCGAKTIEGLPYCRYHSRMAYQPATDRRRDQRV